MCRVRARQVRFIRGGAVAGRAPVVDLGVHPDDAHGIQVGDLLNLLGGLPVEEVVAVRGL